MGRAHMSVTRFRLTTRDSHSVPRAAPIPGGRAHHTESTQRRWLPVVAAHVGWPLLSTAPDPREPSPTLLFPSLVQSHSLLLCSAPAAASPTIPHRRRAAPSCPTGPKGAPSPRAASTPRVCPQRLLSKTGHGISSPPSSSASTSPVAACSDRSPTPPTPQQAPCHQGAPP
jgi:hypothetical protein